MIDLYFFDTYALIETLKANPNYKKYKNSTIILTKLNLFELFYAILKDFNEGLAEELSSQYYRFILDYDRYIIKEAAKFRLKYRKQDLSMTDCIGYCLAKKLGIKFLTGDKEFENFKNVEFVR